MQKHIKVVRLRHGISYIPRGLVHKVPADANIISIVDDEHNRPSFKETQKVHKVPVSLFSGMNAEEHQAIKDFFHSLNGANLFVHCEMGMQRSKNVAHWLQSENPEYCVLRHSTDFVMTEMDL